MEIELILTILFIIMFISIIAGIILVNLQCFYIISEYNKLKNDPNFNPSSKFISNRLYLLSVFGVGFIIPNTILTIIYVFKIVFLQIENQNSFNLPDIEYNRLSPRQKRVLDTTFIFFLNLLLLLIYALCLGSIGVSDTTTGTSLHSISIAIVTCIISFISTILIILLIAKVQNPQV